jgi:hypothetical protein
MTLLIEGFLPISNITPVDPAIGTNNNVGWTGNPVTTLNAEGGSVLSLAFDGTSTDEDYAAFQCGLDGVVQAGGAYRVWLKARETGNASYASWNPHPISMLLISENGKEYGVGQPPNYNLFWGPNTPKNLTSTFQWFPIVLHMPTTEGEATPNSIGISTFPLENNGFVPTRTLELDALIVEELYLP